MSASYTQLPSLYPKLAPTDESDIAKAIEKEHLGHLRVPVVVVMDVSGSMASKDLQTGHRLFGDMNYEQLKEAFAKEEWDALQKNCANSKMQALLKRSFRLATKFDDDGTLEVFLFGEGCFGPFAIDKDNIEIAVFYLLTKINFSLQGTTDYCAFLNKINEHYFSSQEDITKAKPHPPYVMVLTDGDPSIWNKEKKQYESTDIVHQNVKDKFAELSRRPIFFKFLGIGNSDCALLEQLDNQKKIELSRGSKASMLDNIDFVKIKDPGKLTTDEILREYRPWLNEAHKEDVIVLDHATLKLLELYPIKSEGRGVDDVKSARREKSSTTLATYVALAPSAPPAAFNPQYMAIDPDADKLEASTPAPAAPATQKPKSKGILSRLFGSKNTEKPKKGAAKKAIAAPTFS